MNKLGILRGDPYLEPFEQHIVQRNQKLLAKEKHLVGSSASLKDFANGHKYFGIHKSEQNWILREWAPNATGICLTGDFNNWERDEKYSFTRIDEGNWELVLPQNLLQHKHKYKLWMKWQGGADYRIPLFTPRVIQDMESKLFDAQVWVPEKPYKWRNPDFIKKSDSPLLVYEAHIGMADEKEGIGSYKEFTTNVLPRIARLGYNTIQLMAIQEHPYYGSFGYHVSNFFAASSRFGSPEELKELIDTAHGLGIRVIMDIVHSHAVKNSLEGPGMYDGSPGLLFHTNQRREHTAWDSLCFDYGKNEVLHFLLSNCKYWMEEYHFDGFRFDGVTSMLYIDHGLERSFSSYADYFTGNTDEDALVYIGLANKLIHEINPDAVTIAEDMSGMPGIGVDIKDGGLGFDYRLAMGVPDFWIKLIKERKDEDWNVDEIFYELTNYRADEKVISYSESHDQALVGDKTIIFRLADKEMYSHMSVDTPSIIVDRAIALHKLIRLTTIGTNGGGYLNFMGNEFGHPEWIDFPREGNDWSYKYARRQWNLAGRDDLRYKYLLNFDKAMIALCSGLACSRREKIHLIHSNQSNQVFAFKRSKYLFVFNLNPNISFTDYGLPADPADYRILLNSDSKEFGGFDRVNEEMLYESQLTGNIGSSLELKLYLPSRTGIVFETIPIKRAK